MAGPDLAHIRQRLSDHRLRDLFVEELGWDYPSIREVAVTVDGKEFVYEAVAQKRGMLVCVADWHDRVPDHRTRARLERALAKLHLEHIAVYLSGDGTQVWVWARREPGSSVRLRSHWIHPGQSGEFLAQQLMELHVGLEDEGALTLVGITSKARRAFDAETITKAFYGAFEAEQRAFKDFIAGIPTEGDRAWYASVMLNRLMFTYFIQRKGFLDDDPDYLPNRLAAVRAEVGRGHFLSFYRQFLLRLFHGGFSRLPTDPDPLLDKLVGHVPYINGGLFEVHELETRFPDIDVPDEAFERLFDFFGQWKWHLDERPLRDDREVNPDVLGYIFEKYINQKELGAYYTKEDITGYMAGSSVIPVLIERACELCTVAFREDGQLWGMLRENPKRYVHDAVLEGIDEEIPGPIAAGIGDPARREGWNSLAESDFAHPTETWREYIARRHQAERVLAALKTGAVSSPDELVSLNLNLRQFVQDAIDTAEGPEVVRAFYQALGDLTVLDPACGSGAFLFAALLVLEPLYHACLERMRDFLEDPGAGGDATLGDFRSVLDEVERHPNRRYFVLKTILMRNLYGVDLIKEAVEICRLRLFLKLVAQLGDVSELEPLPDIDFNVRAGNSLVGYTTTAGLEESVLDRLDFTGSGHQLVARLAALQERVGSYRDAQLRVGGPPPGGQAKSAVRDDLSSLGHDLDVFLASTYGLDGRDEARLGEWALTHTPFHWPVEFSAESAAGGFDVVIGNPPYIELEQVKGYRVQGFSTLASGNTYALMLERGLQLMKHDGRLAFVVPVSSISTDGYQSLQDLLRSRRLFYSSYDDRPSRLFEGLEHVRLTIHVVGAVADRPARRSTRYHKWYGSERAGLFKLLRYSEPFDVRNVVSLPKLSDGVEREMLDRLEREQRRLGEFIVKAGPGFLNYSRKVGYFLQVLDFAPRVLDGSGKVRAPSEFKQLMFRSEREGTLALACLNSTLFYWFVTILSDCRHLNRREIDAFSIDLGKLSSHAAGDRLAGVVPRLMARLNETSEDRSMRAGKDRLTVQCIFPATAKAIVNEIDEGLGEYLGFSDETIDFVQNYEVKYRLGLGK